jgi:hypothetical protein
VKETKEYLLFDFSTTNHLPIFELVAMGSIVNLDFLKKNFPEIEFIQHQTFEGTALGVAYMISDSTKKQ